MATDVVAAQRRRVKVGWLPAPGRPATRLPTGGRAVLFATAAPARVHRGRLGWWWQAQLVGKLSGVRIRSRMKAPEVVSTEVPV